MNENNVQVGQKWQAAPQFKGQTPRIIEVVAVNEEVGHAVVRNVATNLTVAIRLNRFRPGSRGYTLLTVEEKKEQATA